MPVTVRILPEQLTNKIAAGEVVERPASVVKELVENALDAGGRDITVEIEGGGRRLIRVTDDGHGMSREDLLLSLERHATSKIASDDDLFTLTSLGFRGEALPSIASVSRCTLASRTRESIEGTEVYAEGGKIREVKACGMAGGTAVTVRNLFFNTPARLKFLRSSETEGGHVGEFLTRLALSRPEVRFTYICDGRVSFTVGGGSLRERAAALLGRSLSEGLYPLEYGEGECRVTGLVGRPETTRSTAGLVYTYINGRFIRDRVVQHAVLQAYRTLLERGRYPVTVLFIDIPPSEVDVNVHPTKHEVRFRNQGEVHDIIQRGVESVLRATPWVQQAGTRDSGPVNEAGHGGAGERTASVSEARKESVRESLAAYRPVSLPPFQGKSAHVRSSSPDVIPPLQGEGRGGDGSARDMSPGCDNMPPPHPDLPPEGEGPERAEGALMPRDGGEQGGYFSTLAVIGQYRASYLLCQEGDDLVIIDQHAAHERVAFEKLRDQWRTGKVASQGLLFPETVEFSFAEAAAVREHREELARLGFDLEPFGGATWLLKEVPCLLSGGEPVGTLRDILEELQGVGRSRAISDAAEEALTTIACHSVVRGRRPLAPPEITALLRQMDETGFGANCPHGRPVHKVLSLGEIERMFKR